MPVVREDQFEAARVDLESIRKGEHRKCYRAAGTCIVQTTSLFSLGFFLSTCYFSPSPGYRDSSVSQMTCPVLTRGALEAFFA